MDWDLKMPPPWDLTELDPNTEPNIGLIVGSSSGIGVQASGRRLDCSVDLKLGGLGDFGQPEKWNDHLRVPTATVVPPSGPSKRARAPGNGSQNVSCLVDGCRSDLSGCREYHRRHKVCEAHSKTPIVMVGGQEQRFCQQCSRFHLLVEFDEVKRSCRKRLDGHNRRRRKPQPESINPGSIFSNHPGTRFSSSYPQIFPGAASDPSWPVIVKTEEDQLYSRQSSVNFLNRQHHHFTGSFPRSFKDGKHFPFLQDGEPSICQPLLKTIASAESSCSGSKIFPDGMTQVLDSDCALSLLSSPPQTSAMNLGQILPSGDRIPMGQPLLPYSASLGLGQYSGSRQGPNHVSTTGFSCSGMEDDHLGSTTVLVSDGSDAEMNCHGLFGVGGEGSSDGGSQALPFSWQ
ncbi:uncharacterized protein M6B38_340460 [Iris pallida]|uniref:SBP-type domain-containing protein n=1 Tax=Iris pallida TaxID=29817 RepID=A0AAX6GYA4_IRIPA|nr:uncharacterized protein M6B38_129265 [Iris pallida]KAJ6833301.1 uncharacterized protein M6B38_340460 [Iris pallida]